MTLYIQWSQKTVDTVLSCPTKQVTLYIQWSHKTVDTVLSCLTKHVTLYLQWSHKAGDTVLTGFTVLKGMVFHDVRPPHDDRLWEFFPHRLLAQPLQQHTTIHQSTTHTHTLFYRSQTKLRKGNVFTPVCQSFCSQGGVCPSACWDTHTPPSRHPPGQRPLPPGRHPPNRWLLLWTVRILLECILFGRRVFHPCLNIPLV